MMKAVNDIWDGIKNMSMAIMEEFKEIIKESKKPNYYVKYRHLKSQVLDKKPKFVRIRGNC